MWVSSSSGFRHVDYSLLLQISMNVSMVLPSVALMLTVPIPLVASPVPVVMVTEDMDSPVQVINYWPCD